MSQPLVLVVDDEGPVREFLVDVLLELGWHVRQAIHGAQALALASEERPDLVISDVMMPVMDGAELCRRLKKDFTPPPVIILASAAPPRVVEDAGADAFLSKPFDLGELERLVNQLLPKSLLPEPR